MDKTFRFLLGEKKVSLLMDMFKSNRGEDDVLGSGLASLDKFAQNIFIPQLRKMLLRQEAIPRPTRLPMPCEGNLDVLVPGDFRVGYSCNLLNNNYILYKVARRMGLDARLFLDPGFADMTVTAHPAWEEGEYQGLKIPADIGALPPFALPDSIATANWNLDLLSAVYSHGLGHLAQLLDNSPVPVHKDDLDSLLLAYSVVPHQELLRLYNDVDVLHVSGSHIGLASFTSKPYVTMPFGGDLFSLPFEDTELGWMQARGFRLASRHLVTGKIMHEYMEALGIAPSKMDVVPFMVDTQTYKPMPANPLRQELRRLHPGKVLFLLGARQNFHWKGNDKFWKALSLIRGKIPNAFFLSVWYGQDAASSRKMLEDYGLQDAVQTVGILAKGTLRRYIDAVDVCVDQFTHGGFGTFALECMGMGKPLITYFNAAKHFDFERQPPVFSAFSPEEIAEKVAYCIDNPGDLAEHGASHRKWVSRYHGHEALWPQYYDCYRKTLATAKYRK